MTNDRAFDRLSPDERTIVGDPEDYDWEHPVEPPPAERPQGRSQFSMRIDPLLYGELAIAAQSRSMTFSEVVREALERYVGRAPFVPGHGMISFGNATVVMSGTIRLGVLTRGPSAVITGADVAPHAITEVATGT